jgi:phosphoglucomutase
MGISPLAGKPAPKEMVVDVARLEGEYYDRKPDLGDRNQRVSFGTSGHRGSPRRGTFTEAHIHRLGRKTSTRSMRKASRTRPTWMPS